MSEEHDRQLIREIALAQGIEGETCRNCWFERPWAKHLCKTCLQYLWRNNHPRPIALVEESLRRKGLLA